MNDTRKTNDIRLRASKAEKQLAINIAKLERRTLSSFILNLIHERSEYHAKVEANRGAPHGVDASFHVPSSGQGVDVRPTQRPIRERQITKRTRRAS